MNDEITTSEIMDFLREHMVTRSDLDRFATKEDLFRSQIEVMSSVDRFAKFHETLDLELVALQVWASEKT
jgi:hypothetical protein